MAYLVIPKEITARTANIWVAAINEEINPATAFLRFGAGQLALDQNWNLYKTASGRNFIHYQHVNLWDLPPASDFALEFGNENLVRASGHFRTLPNELPTIDQRPLNVLLGSCFAAGREDSVHLGSSYLNLQRFEPTDIKILCGDQVYLDDPWNYFLLQTHSFEDLEDLLFSKYVETWTQNKSLTGFQQFLASGGNYFSSDDHEFWNNAPNRATLIRDSWSGRGRENWLKIARRLLGIFQSEFSSFVFNVGTLSFFIADTRIHRDENRGNFMRDEDLAALQNWVENLGGVGVLVVGQPIFSEKAGFFGGRFGDWNMPNYAQYGKLAQILMKSNHSILVLTGDVHYGRIARCRIKPGVDLYEIISSPTSLVNEKVGGSWHAAPDRFPVESVPGVVQQTVINNISYKVTKNHFLVLSFYQHGARTRVVMKVCEIVGSGARPQPRVIDEFELF